MDFDEQNLAARLESRAAGVHATPDVDAVVGAADRRRRRSRMIGMTGAAAVAALGVAGVVLVAQRDVAEAPSAAPVVTAASADTVAPDEPATTTRTDEAPPETDVAAPTPKIVPPYVDPNAADPADAYLDRTTEVYRRVMPSGYDLQVRVSDVSYGDLFDIEWDLPTGSREECLSDPAALIGDPNGIVQWVSAWTVLKWAPLEAGQDFSVATVYTDPAVTFVVRTDLPAVDITLDFGGEQSDAAPFVDGVAAVEMPGYPEDDGDGGGDYVEPLLSVSVDGESEPRVVPLYGEYGDSEPDSVCQATQLPAPQLPPPGAEQPADPAADEATIRERHALLIDRTQTADEKPDDLLDDDTGVADARAEMEAGSFADAASKATYTIDDLVFTDATTAWFVYTIYSPSGTFGNRFGEAVFNGDVWQITRATICQDLGLAGGNCDGPDQSAPNLLPPGMSQADLDQLVEDQARTQQRYYEALFCNPLNPCNLDGVPLD